MPIFSDHFFDQTSFLIRADVAKKGRVALGHSTHLLVVNCEDLATAQCPASQHPQRNQDHPFCLLCKWAQPVFNDTKWDSSPAVIAFPSNSPSSPLHLSNGQPRNTTLSWTGPLNAPATWKRKSDSNKTGLSDGISQIVCNLDWFVSTFLAPGSLPKIELCLTVLLRKTASLREPFKNYLTESPLSFSGIFF